MIMTREARILLILFSGIFYAGTVLLFALAHYIEMKIRETDKE